MTSAVNSWKQAGRVFVWQYPQHKKNYRGWHFTCEDAACDSLTNLVTAMRTEGEPSKRSISLSQTTWHIWRVPNVGESAKEIYQNLVVEYDPNFDDLVLSEHDSRLRLHFGDGSASILIEAIADVKAGRGDYVLPSKNHKDVPPIWIWWMVRAKQ